MTGHRRWSELRAELLAGDPLRAAGVEAARVQLEAVQARQARYDAVVAASPLPAEGPLTLDQAQAEHDRLLGAARELAGPEGDVTELHDVCSCVCCCWTCGDLAERIVYEA